MKDEQGKEYIDLGTGIAVNAFGVGDKAWKKAVKEKEFLRLFCEKFTLAKQKILCYNAHINSNINLKDTIYVEKVVYKDVVIDTITNKESGTIHLEKKDIFNKSNRYISANVPYTASHPSNLSIGDASFIVEQNIFVEGPITRDNKTKETMFYLKTDYPGVTFNSGKGVVPTNGKQYDRDARKRNG